MDWASIKNRLRLHSGRSKRANEKIIAERKKQLTQATSMASMRDKTLLEKENESPSRIIDQKAQPVRRPKTAGGLIPSKSQLQSPITPSHKDFDLRVDGNGNGTPIESKKLKKHQRSQSERKVSDYSVVKEKSTEDADEFDLHPPVPAKKSRSIDEVSNLLFSDGHLDSILQDSELFVRFTSFLHRYRPQLAPVLVRYVETQKAIKAVEYANAVAESVVSLPSETATQQELIAAHMNSSFQGMSKEAFQTLLSEALPAYITYHLIKVTSEIMINDITGRQTPIMKGLVSGLSEVFCLTDPNQEDNPIIYASEEFYNMTGYSCDYVIGSNCRFLQGPQTKRHSVHRLRKAVDSGQELSETILNYRRDGRPFMNVLMIAPLHDNKGKVKYHIGAQVDASGLVERSVGLDSFQHFQSIEQDKREGRGRRPATQPIIGENGTGSIDPKQKALAKLGELSELFDLEETGVISQRSRSNSRSRRSSHIESVPSTPKHRRVFNEASDDEPEDDDEAQTVRSAWSLAQTPSSGKLPGVYQSYFLMRPSPSLKIIFVSPALRSMGNLVQSPFLSHVTAPPATLNGLKDSFASGNPVTAKVLFSASASESETGQELNSKQSERRLEDAASKQTGRTTWISATPLLGADGRVGVWMVVVISAQSLGTGGFPTNGRHGRSSTMRSEDILQSGSSTLRSFGSEPEHSRQNTRPATRPNYIHIPDRLGSLHSNTSPTGKDAATNHHKSPLSTEQHIEKEEEPKEKPEENAIITPEEKSPKIEEHQHAILALLSSNELPKLLSPSSETQNIPTAAIKTPNKSSPKSISGASIKPVSTSAPPPTTRPLTPTEKKPYKIILGSPYTETNHTNNNNKNNNTKDSSSSTNHETTPNTRPYTANNRPNTRMSFNSERPRTTSYSIPHSQADFTPGKSSVKYMDYLRHPGSNGKGALTEANLRAMSLGSRSGSDWHSGMGVGVGVGASDGGGGGVCENGDLDGDADRDGNGARSPFSVDVD